MASTDCFKGDTEERWQGIEQVQASAGSNRGPAPPLEGAEGGEGQSKEGGEKGAGDAAKDVIAVLDAQHENGIQLLALCIFPYQSALLACFAQPVMQIIFSANERHGADVHGLQHSIAMHSLFFTDTSGKQG